MKKLLLIAALVFGAIGIASTAAATNESQGDPYCHVNCETTTTTIVDETTSTTAAPTTTAPPASTPTTVVAEVTTTTVAPATTVAGSTTTTAATPAVVVSTPKPKPTPVYPTSLPATGSDDLVLALVALGFTLTGITALVAARRKTARR